ncbi:hypothetical protein [Caulobacter hibisci]|uniref:Uncharacterized protein n=1 Tax=Caulobacter hibisci TaxID=2035993 RepID=A0ABS0T2E6_9CAUL|nr:hypothetical protein [Caulobacter hibisci]MBI1685989.1 hypothetical protein [Caulobacter hibisci]
MAEPADTEADDAAYDPSTPEANRAIQQGIGVGARDLAAQRDPGEGDAPLEDAVDEDEDG